MKSLVEIAETQVGVREVGGNNRGEALDKYKEATTLGRNGLPPSEWAWCAAFVCWCVKEYLLQPELQGMAPAQRPKTAGAKSLLTWARDQGLPVKNENNYHPVPGDIVVYDFSHCGIITGYSAGTITTIEGNTNGKGERDSTSGDGVWRKTRSTSLVLGYIVMPKK